MAPEITAESVWSHIPKRPRESNKGSFGAVLAVAGSACYRGAASLTVEGALRTGGGHRHAGQRQAGAGGGVGTPAGMLSLPL